MSVETDASFITNIQAVIIYDDEGNYLIHGSNKENFATMVKIMAPLWNIDPSKESMKALEFEILLPKIASQSKARVYQNT